ncbi:hypothetical protein SEA_ZOOBEAR_74 [Streptomyces phage ZooBear]|uniref:Uncharacterized protein n=3 Tax=Immanueltrevirus immanuel3 TaxID=2846399 RepID=A0A2H5BME5_9CAUD|nr:hypothetical protein SEA_PERCASTROPHE_74 [Streptomyces phage Percastrophe]AUG87506.1 hypothetical protein SEA_ROMERO_74 [Streptomyces phage Romero]AUG87635.1 hypothetical protein SEA_ZOOBEAR_74 [Streptomyces phage ZooBear]
MAVPSRPAQIKRIAEFLEDSANAERTVQEVATRIVDGIYDMWAVDVTEAPQVPKVDMAFKTPNLTSKVYHVAWIGEEFTNGPEVCWVIESGSDFGMFVPLKSEFWKILTPSTAKAGGRGKNKDGIEPGDKYSLMQRRSHFTVLEVGDKTVLLRDNKFGSLQADSNANIKKYYQRERA